MMVAFGFMAAARCVYIVYTRYIWLYSSWLSHSKYLITHALFKYLIIIFIFLFYFVIMFCNSVRVSNEIGSGNSNGAKFATMVVVSTSLSIGIIFFFIFLFLRERVSYIFTTSEAVATQVADLSPLLAFSILLNSIQPVLSGMYLAFSILLYCLPYIRH